MTDDQRLEANPALTNPQPPSAEGAALERRVTNPDAQPSTTVHDSGDRFSPRPSRRRNRRATSLLAMYCASFDQAHANLSVVINASRQLRSIDPLSPERREGEAASLGQELPIGPITDYS